MVIKFVMSPKTRSIPLVACNFDLIRLMNIATSSAYRDALSLAEVSGSRENIPLCIASSSIFCGGLDGKDEKHGRKRVPLTNTPLVN
jgi:hypothetical protein